MRPNSIIVLEFLMSAVLALAGSGCGSELK